jgi:aerobic carbon-monoxide dehydrogenase medium subunit
MIPAPFDYHRAATLDEAIGLLARYGPDAKLLSGGMSLLPTLKLRLGSYGHLIDISRIAALEYVREEGGVVRIGAGTRQCTLERSEVIRSRYGALADAVPLIADPLVRNRGTIGGNLANGDPANDAPAIVIALGAELVARGPRGERTIPANRFYKALYETALAADEILVEVRLPLPPARSGSAYRKLKRKTGDFAVAGVAVALTLKANGAVERAGIALTNVGPTPLEALQAERRVAGNVLDEKTIAEAALLAAQAAAPSADRRGSVEYKREMTRVLAGRALKAALQRAGGGA